MKAWQKHVHIITLFVLSTLPQAFNQELPYSSNYSSVPPPPHNFTSLYVNIWVCIFSKFGLMHLHCVLEAIITVLYRASILHFLSEFR